MNDTTYPELDTDEMGFDDPSDFLGEDDYYDEDDYYGEREHDEAFIAYEPDDLDGGFGNYDLAY